MRQRPYLSGKVPQSPRKDVVIGFNFTHSHPLQGAGRITDGLGAEREVLTRIFRKYDLNEDGLLQLDEFEQFCGAFGLSQAKSSPDEIRALFERYDLDDSGTLAFREFSAAMLKQAASHRSR